LTDKIPSAGGFSAGFLMGARRGWGINPSIHPSIKQGSI
jgi:hypothetical protein